MTVCIIILLMFVVFFICADIILVTSNVGIVDINYRGVIYIVYIIIAVILIIMFIIIKKKPENLFYPILLNDFISTE